MKIEISKSYGKKHVFEKFALEIEEGKILCVLGGSGCGKTTLLNILSGLTDCEGELTGVPSEVAYIFQEPRLLPNLTVEQNLLYAGAKREEIPAVLEKIEMSALKDRRPKALSGGEKQRVAIARAFLSNASLLLLDEPFSSLDTALKIRLAKVFAELWKNENKTAVFVTHDIEEALMLAHRVIVIREGEIAADISLSDGEIPRAYGAERTARAALLTALLGNE